ncbi:hypothetical protein [Mitsuokella multacida]|uniref:hypothetical protein n=1 Tax=Mitsuokella multacida TaxID=52226 RepID=UPI00265A1232|nr:hypothetical protein [Mitsuokella multacida]
MYKQVLASILLCCSIIFATPVTLADDTNLDSAAPVSSGNTVQGNVSEDNTAVYGENNVSSGNTFIPGNGNVSMGNTYIGGNNNTSHGNTYIQGDNNVSIGNTHIAGSNNVAEGNTYVGGSNNTHIGETTVGTDNKYSSNRTYYGASNQSSKSNQPSLSDIIVRIICALILLMILAPIVINVGSFIIDVVQALARYIINKYERYRERKKYTPLEDEPIIKETAPDEPPTEPAAPPVEPAAPQSVPPSPPPPPLLPKFHEGIFVSVEFRKGGKAYDYFLGKHTDVKIGDKVEVYVHDRRSHRLKKKKARVVYISEPGEISPYARSEISRKL